MAIALVATRGLECRDNRCRWIHVRVHDERLPLWGHYRWDQCSNCKSWRCRIECTDGSITPNTTTYEYSQAYMEAKEYTREDCRRELNKRAKVQTKKKPATPAKLVLVA